ncbi:MAG TPA: hypothetical protein VK508_06740 [Cyclobacteriaceae bacterium]|nr:hypothetical protein [Cyclobacteriaceae bacterium]
MGKIIRPRYPVEFSIGLLILVFSLSFLLSFQFFVVSWRKLVDGSGEYWGMFLAAIATTVTALVLWEELLFPVKVKADEHGAIFRNHSTKLKTQLLIYCVIPVIFTFIYATYEVRTVRFMIFATVCIIVPVITKLISGIKNYNDFLRLGPVSIEYRNNDESGTFRLNDIRQIALIRDGGKVLHKVQLLTVNNNQVMIDLDEMELDAFLDAIDRFIVANYENLVTEKAQLVP